MVRRKVRGLGLRKGRLHMQLGISVKRKIPRLLLRKIVKTGVGVVIRNPTVTGRRRIRVTSLLRKRAFLALRLKNFRWSLRSKSYKGKHKRRK